jgi:steroid 5-alpha reductase family enzyme
VFDIDFIAHPLRGTPFGTALDLCLILAALGYLLGTVTRDYVWIDRVWTLCPPLYCLIVAAGMDFASPRVNLMTALVVLWSARLTFNAVRKGVYRPGGEDYRWAAVREKMGPVALQVVNLTFISFGQMLLIWLFTSPIHQASVWVETPLGWLDFLAAALFLALFVGEAVADGQMWRFQQDKKRRIAAGEDVAQPFLTSGLFRHSRHPNFFCELGMWWVFHLFAVSASDQWLHWTGLGFILLTALFIPSTRLTEEISASKYPGYRDYQATTPALVPGLRLRR